MLYVGYSKRYSIWNDHSWNYVYVDGEWKMLDVTWNNTTGSSRRYFLVDSINTRTHDISVHDFRDMIEMAQELAIRIHTVHPAPERLVLSADPIADIDNANVTVGNKLSWNAVSGVSRFDIFRSGQGGAFTRIATGVTSTTYVDLDIVADTEYRYVVTPAGVTHDNAAASNIATVKTGPGSFPNLPDRNGNMGRANGFILMQIDNPLMNVNGEIVEVDLGRGTAPMLHNGRTMLPIRSVLDVLGGDAQWHGAEQRAVLMANGNTVEMWIGRMDYLVNGIAHEMDVAPFIENERTFLPLRFAAFSLNCRATWINATREILIVYNSGAG